MQEIASLPGNSWRKTRRLSTREICSSYLIRSPYEYWSLVFDPSRCRVCHCQIKICEQLEIIQICRSAFYFIDISHPFSLPRSSKSGGWPQVEAHTIPAIYVQRPKAILAWMTSGFEQVYNSFKKTCFENRSGMTTPTASACGQGDHFSFIVYISWFQIDLLNDGWHWLVHRININDSGIFYASCWACWHSY